MASGPVSRTGGWRDGKEGGSCLSPGRAQGEGAPRCQLRAACCPELALTLCGPGLEDLGSSSSTVASIRGQQGRHRPRIPTEETGWAARLWPAGSALTQGQVQDVGAGQVGGLLLHQLKHGQGAPKQ